MATDAQEGASEERGAFADLLDALKENPLALTSDLPNAQEWANRLFLRTDIKLEGDKSFLEQIVKWLSDWDNGIVNDATGWDPYDDGYDDGPGDLMDCWHTDEHTSNGQYRGTTVDCNNVFDLLGALIVCVTHRADDCDQESMEAEFKRMAEKDWIAPASDEVRDETLLDQDYAAIYRCAWMVVCRG